MIDSIAYAFDKIDQTLNPPPQVVAQMPAWEQGLMRFDQFLLAVYVPEDGAALSTGSRVTQLAPNDVVIGFTQDGRILGQSTLGTDFSTAMSHEQLAQQLGILQSPGVLSQGAEAFTLWNENGQIMIRGSGNFNPTVTTQTETLLQGLFQAQ